MNFFFPPHSRVQSCSILRGVARAHRVGVVPNCTMGLFLERYRFCHWLLKRCTGKWVKTCTSNTVPQCHSTNHRASLKRHIKCKDKQISFSWDKPSTNVDLTQVDIIQGPKYQYTSKSSLRWANPHFCLLQSILYYLSPPVLGEESY